MDKKTRLLWNADAKLILSDVDDTIAEVYTPADPRMIIELSSLLHEGYKLFLVTGGSLLRVRRDISNFVEKSLRHNILISHCSGVEVWGFTKDGELRERPFYSLYEKVFTESMKSKWRTLTQQLVREFGFRTHTSRPKPLFWKTIGNDPRDIMLDDRGPQITFEIVNGLDLTPQQLTLFTQEVPKSHDNRNDLRLALLRRAGELLEAAALPVTPRLGGVYAVDLAIVGASKLTSIKYVLENDHALAAIDLSKNELQSPRHFEIWGDRFSEIAGGTDQLMSMALPPSVRSIDFRNEDPNEFPEGYSNILLWNGAYHQHLGLLEYLMSRH